ncbi:glycosyltransferase family 2 protein [Haloferacaceae archaeon DSL9]
MELSVVVPTLNGRDRLAASLDALAAAVPDAEVIVVNGPSADGTTGMVRERDDVDVLVELSDRSVNVARNAGIEVATGDVIGFVGYDSRVEEGWVDAVETSIANAAVVTGPTHRTLRTGMTTETLETRTIGGREVRYFAGGNVAFRTGVLERLDGFDEYLPTGGARDMSHRLAGVGHAVAWNPEMSVCCEYETDGGHPDRDWGWKYRSLAYRLVKNYGIKPTVVRRTAAHATSDSVDAANGVVRSDESASAWFGNGRDVVQGIARGAADGFVARRKDRSAARNPNGISKRSDRAVARYEWRD